MYNKSMKDPEVRNTIREMYHQQGMSGAAIGTVLGIPARTILDYIAGNTWNGEGRLQYNPEDVKLSKDVHLVGVGDQNSRPKISKILEVLKKYDPTAPRSDKSVEPEHDNSRILLISDLHVPYHHPDALEFLQYLVDKYEPTRVICLGDEVDHLALSYHEKETDAPSAIDELKMALPVIKELEKMFPVMDILDSNHGSLAYRKAKTAGIPKHYLKSYADVLQVGDGWKWHFDMVIDLPHGSSCYLHHGKSSNITKTSQAMSMCAVAGHYHNTFKVEYWANPKGLYWAMQCGCLIDDRSFAFNYNNVNLHRPLIGTGLIIDGLPVLEPMVLDKNGRWVLRK